MSSELRSVSDTARLTADMRAREGERRAPLFVDAHAAELAGPRAGRIAPMRRWLVSDGGVIARTAALDEIVLHAVGHQGIGAVLNLGAGLDTRPYRLQLPADLQWVEADLPDIVADKEERLAGAVARCRLARHAVDLSDEAALMALVRSLGDTPALVLSEGLLPYLEPDVAAGLAQVLATCPAPALWCVDLISAELLPWANLFGGRTAASAEAMARFAPADGPDWFRPFGWKAREVRAIWLEQRRLHRGPVTMRVLWAIGPSGVRRFYRDMGRIVLLARPSSGGAGD